MTGRFWARPGWQVAILGLLGLVTRLPFRSHTLYNWDSVNFALGILDFNIVKHRPHPPGYILYVALGKALNPVTGDPNASLVWLSIAAGVLSVWLIYALGRCLFSERDGFVAALLFMFSPLAWFYHEVALTYALEGFFSIAIAYCCCRTLTRSPRAGYAAALLLGVAAGVRQTTFLIMLPLALYTARRLAWRHRLGAAALTAAICLGWALPLLADTGGLAAYLAASRDLSTKVGPGRFVDMFNSLFYGGHVAFLLVLADWLGLLPVDDATQVAWRRWFMILWLVPGLLVIAFGHIGQAGYLLFALPALFLYTPGLLRRAITRLEQAWPAPGGRRQSSPDQKMLLTALTVIVIGAVAFLLGSSRFIRDQDRRWLSAQALDIRHPPSQTVILTDTRRDGAFRHVSYYLPDYRVYAFASLQLSDPLPVEAAPGVAGWLFYSYQGEDNYDLDATHHQLNTQLDLPPGTTGLLVSEASLATVLSDAQGNPLPVAPAGGRLSYVALPESARRLVATDGRLQAY
jgi:hypothetical protein